MKARFMDEQIIAMIKEQEAGEKAADVCRRHGISSATFYKVQIEVWRDGGQGAFPICALGKVRLKGDQPLDDCGLGLQSIAQMTMVGEDVVL